MLMAISSPFFRVSTQHRANVGDAGPTLSQLRLNVSHLLPREANPPDTRR